MRLSTAKHGILVIATLVLIVGLTTVMALAIRLAIVEPEPVAQACLAGAEGWRCVVREIAVYGFLKNVFGWTALLTGILATVSRWRSFALIAMVSGICGAVLYTFELSGLGLLLGALVWIQRSPERTQLSEENRRAHQSTEQTP